LPDLLDRDDVAADAHATPEDAGAGSCVCGVLDVVFGHISEFDPVGTEPIHSGPGATRACFDDSLAGKQGKRPLVERPTLCGVDA
jgi:hypothetical protein